MAEPDSGCGVCDYELVPCGCFLDCVSEAVCGAPEIEGRIVGVDGIHVVEDEMQWDGVASELEKEKGRCLSWLWGACSLEQEDK